jgi:hypothetical protein
MTETASHTPGPWEVAHDHLYPSVRPDIGFIRPHNWPTETKLSWGHNEIALAFGCEHPEQQANMRLIAAAPLLLTTLQKVFERHRGGAAEYSWQEMDEIRAALTLAAECPFQAVHP